MVGEWPLLATAATSLLLPPNTESAVCVNQLIVLPPLLDSLPLQVLFKHLSLRKILSSSLVAELIEGKKW